MSFSTSMPEAVPIVPDSIGTVRGADGRLVLGDVIQAIDGETIDGLGALQTVLDRYDPGDEVLVTILRDGRTTDVRIGLL